MGRPKKTEEPPLRVRALAFLARREHSRLELERKLARYRPDPGELTAVLDEFERKGFLSERRVAEQVAAQRAGRYGAHRVAHELRQKGVAEAVIATVLPGLESSELERARAVWQKKFGVAAKSAAEAARQMRFLQGRGFSPEAVRRVVRWRGE